MGNWEAYGTQKKRRPCSAKGRASQLLGITSRITTHVSFCGPLFANVLQPLPRSPHFLLPKRYRLIGIKKLKNNFSAILRDGRIACIFIDNMRNCVRNKEERDSFNLSRFVMNTLRHSIFKYQFNLQDALDPEVFEATGRHYTQILESVKSRANVSVIVRF